MHDTLFFLHDDDEAGRQEGRRDCYFLEDE